MTNISQLSVAALEAKLKDLDSKIAARLKDDVFLFDEWKFVRGVIDRKRSGTTNVFEGVRTPRQAFERVLMNHGPWMTSGAMVAKLREGGWITTKTQEWKMKALINYNSEPGKTFQRIGDPEGWDTLIGLKGYPPPSK